MTTTQPTCTLIETPAAILTNKARDAVWCVYEHHILAEGDTTPVLVFIGACKLRDVYTLNDARRNSEWPKVVPDAKFLYIKIVLTGTQHACRTHLTLHVNAQNPRPRCNAYGYDMTGLSRVIVCSNGVEYHSQAEASKALGLNQGQLSRHLAGEVGFRSIKGYTFAYKHATHNGI